jgi:gamma-glutamyltranspeptidase/glutathione hydrolase
VENGPVVNVESHLPAGVVDGLRSRGHRVLEFGSAQLIFRAEHGYIAASDSRGDGQAVGF